MNNSPIEFDTLEPIRVPVKIGNEQYYLHEASVDASTAYRNALMASRRELPDGSTTVNGLASAEVLYLSLSLYDSQAKLVPIHVLGKWPARIQRALFDRLEEISDTNNSDAPERVALEATLNLPESPMTYDAFRKWVNGLRGQVYQPLQMLIKDVGELAKNGQAGTTTVST